MICENGSRLVLRMSGTDPIEFTPSLRSISSAELIFMSKISASSARPPPMMPPSMAPMMRFNSFFGELGESGTVAVDRIFASAWTRSSCSRVSLERLINSS